jgi:outer membrane protein assembly factor BamB
MGWLVALDPATGATSWEARDAKPTYGTPAAARIGNVWVVVTPNGDCVRADDGAVLSRALGSATYASPVVGDGVVYFAGPPLVAVALPETCTDRLQVKRLWQADDIDGTFFASPLIHGGLLYCVTNEGTLHVFDAKAGAPVYRTAVAIRSASGAAGAEPANMYPSPARAGEFLLMGNDAGEMLVIACGREYRQIGRNYLDAGSGASPALAGSALFLRAGARLICVRAK